jgi:predicted aspartyl protease
MNRLQTVFAFCVLVLPAASAAVAAEQNCTLSQLASLDFGTDPNGIVYVAADINGHPENLVVDTGGIVSTLTWSTVQQLRLNTEALSGFVEIEGVRLVWTAVGDKVQLGALTANHMPFLVMPDYLMKGDKTGILAPDIMSNYDVELDFAKGKFNLFSPDHCLGQVVYWTHQPYAEVPFQLDRIGHILISAQLDGKSIQVVLDTGSPLSRMPFETARELFGWDDKLTDLKVLDRRKDGSPASYRYPFKSLSLAGVSVANPDVVLNVLEKPGEHRIGVPSPQLLLGMSTLRQLHIYIAYHERNLYFTSAGAR